jgi:tRNA pseudouridine38-40 synthase
MEEFTYKFLLQYDGTDYQGWQIQKKREVSIQGQIHMALEKITKSKKVETIGSGRTDAGVHALGQVFRAKLVRKLPHRLIQG